MFTCEDVVREYCRRRLSRDKFYYMRRMVEYVSANGGGWDSICEYLYLHLDKSKPQDYSPATIYTQYRILQAAYKHCEESGLISACENVFYGQRLSQDLTKEFRRLRNIKNRGVCTQNHKFKAVSLDRILRQVGKLPEAVSPVKAEQMSMF